MVNGWTEITLEELCKPGGLVRGPFGGALKKEIFVTSGYKVYEQQNAIYNSTEIGNYYITNEKYRKLQRFAISDGDFIVSCSGTIGCIYQLPLKSPRGIINQALLKITIDEERVNAELFQQYFRSEDFQKLIIDDTQGGAMKNLVGMEKFRKTLFIIPKDKNEQTRIATTFFDTDKLIISLKNLIEKKKAIKQGTMQQLLTGTMRLEGFTDEWIEKKIGDIGKFYSGLSGKTKNDFGVGNSQYITFLNVLTNNYIDTSILEKVFIKQNEIQNQVQKGDLFFNTSSETPEEVGMCSALLEEINNTYLNSFCFGVRLTQKNIDPLFISYYFNSKNGRDIMSVLAQGATRYNLSKSSFSEVVIKIPSFKEQTAIANILSDMDSEIEILEQRLEKYKQVKQGMMQQLLTGKIRLVSSEDVQKTKTEKKQESKQGHNHQFDDAVAIACIVDKFYSDKYWLGRKKIQKLLYLLRRKQDTSVENFKKKAAGPYADEVRYKGGEPIAKSNGYICVKTSKEGSSFTKGKNIDKALEYAENWGLTADINWLVQKFQYYKVDELEVLATIDMAICDLTEENKKISVDSIKNLIHSNEEWKNKLTKSYFSDKDIAEAIKKCENLF